MSLFLPEINTLKARVAAVAIAGFTSFVAAQPRTVVEYANRDNFPNAPYAQFFYTSDPLEQADLDAGKHGAFVRTGGGFVVDRGTPTCRFYGSVYPGPNSHFFGYYECRSLQASQKVPTPLTEPQWNYEGPGFPVSQWLTAPGIRRCFNGTNYHSDDPSLTPMFRLYNAAYGASGKRNFDSNHRYTTRQAEVDFLTQRGWINEGIYFCVESPEIELPSSSSLAQSCAAPRAADRQGTLNDENKWLRSFAEERYLWYNEIARTPTEWTAQPLDYFNTLRTNARTPSGKLKDEFHFTQNTAAYQASQQGTASASYGWRVVAVRSSPPREYVIAYTEPNGNAAAMGVARGDRILAIDTIDMVNGSNTSGLNAGLSPTTNGETHLYKFERQDKSVYEVSLTAGSFSSTSVQVVKAIDTPTGKVGYLHFSAFRYPTEGAFAAAIADLRAQQVTDLVLDMRYNGGGLLYLAAEIGYMIAGPKGVGKTFYRLTLNNKRVTENNDPSNNYTFFNTASGYSGTNTTRGTALPTLNLNRVYVLTSSGTASASEAVINGLKGIGVEVILIGATTTGKPYGFLPTDNCGTTYFLIEFKGNNFQGFGDYADGFAATCEVADDLTKALGDPLEARLAGALFHRSTGRCAAPSALTQSVKRDDNGRIVEPLVDDAFSMPGLVRTASDAFR